MSPADAVQSTHLLQRIDFDGQFDYDAEITAASPNTSQKIRIGINKFTFRGYHFSADDLVDAQAVTAREGAVAAEGSPADVSYAGNRASI